MPVSKGYFVPSSKHCLQIRVGVVGNHHSNRSKIHLSQREEFITPDINRCLNTLPSCGIGRNSASPVTFVIKKESVPLIHDEDVYLCRRSVFDDAVSKKYFFNEI